MAQARAIITGDRSIIRVTTITMPTATARTGSACAGAIGDLGHDRGPMFRPVSRLWVVFGRLGRQRCNERASETECF
jgi:hypothetical protein